LSVTGGRTITIVQLAWSTVIQRILGIMNSQSDGSTVRQVFFKFPPNETARGTLGVMEAERAGKLIAWRIGS
jgi:hypothetical protein